MYRHVLHREASQLLSSGAYMATRTIRSEMLSLLSEVLLNSLGERVTSGKKEIILHLFFQRLFNVYHLHRAHVGHSVYFFQLTKGLDDR